MHRFLKSWRRSFSMWQMAQTAGLLWPGMLLVAGILIMVGIVMGADSRWWSGLSLMLILASGMVFLLRLRHRVFKPLSLLEHAVAQISQGEPGAHLPQSDMGIFKGLTDDIESISDELMDLYEDMDSRIARHTTRLAQKTASLKILYDVAATINQLEDLDELLIQFLRVLKEMVNGIAVSARLQQEDGSLRLVGSIGLDDRVHRENDMLPLEICPCGKVLSPGDVLCEQEAAYCVKQLGYEMFPANAVDVIRVPLDYHGNVLGYYSIYVKKPGVADREDILELLETVGSHLGMAVAKQRSDDEALHLSILQERNALAHELHDSLAQTLASLRYQVRMMEDTFDKEGACDMAKKDLLRIRNGMDEAHTELRELLNGFRVAVHGRDLGGALEKLVSRFSSETGIATYLQLDCEQVHLNSAEEMQMLRIVQESLANIRKHAQARMVRVLLACNSGGYTLLIEDDGVGFEGMARDGHPGEHIGLSIMEERARRLGGSLKIESEVGEGTRVELTYTPQQRLRDVDGKWGK